MMPIGTLEGTLITRIKIFHILSHKLFSAFIHHIMTSSRGSKHSRDPHPAGPTITLLRDCLGLNIGLLTADKLLELEELQGEGDVVGKVFLGIEAELGAIALVALNVQTDGGATAASAGQTDDNAGAVIELGVQALVLRDAAVEVSVGEVTGVNDLAARDGGADEGVAVGDEVGQDTDDLVSTFAVDVLVVVASEEGTAVGLPEVILDGSNAGGLVGGLLGHTSNDVQPGDNGPDTVLLTDMVAASAEGLLATDRDLLVIKQVAEELPTGGHLVALETLGLGDTVNGTGSRHGAGEAVHALLLEPGDELSVVGNNGQTVTGGDERVGAVDHVAVTVTVTGGTEVHTVLVDGLNELVGIDEVGVGVATAKVRQGLAVHGAAGGQAELLLEDVHTVGASDTVHAVEEHLKVLVGVKEVLDQVEIEDLLHHSHVIGGGVDNLDLDGAVALGANDGGVNIGHVNVVVGGEGLGSFIDLVGHGLGGRSTVGQVVLDAEVVIGT